MLVRLYRYVLPYNLFTKYPCFVSLFLFLSMSLWAHQSIGISPRHRRMQPLFPTLHFSFYLEPL